jgi:class 3 adenylate cyclase
LGILGGSAFQKLVFAALLGVYALALGFSAQDKMERIGRPDVGWVADLDGTFSPSRLDASDMGLRGGGRVLAINGIPIDPLDFERQSPELAVLEPGASNTIRFERWGQVHELTIPVADWTWQDALFTHGLIDILALLFMVTALASFALRPYEATSWSILTLASVTGSLITVSLLPEGNSSLQGIYLNSLNAMLPFAILHAGLAYPVVHPLILRRFTVLSLYGLGAVHAGVQVGAWLLGWWGPFRHVGTFGTALVLASVLLFIARCSALAIRTRDPLVAQRARILLVAAIVGGSPPAAAAALRDATDWFALDMRLVYWAMAFFFVPLGYISVRQNLVNARSAARQAVAYAGVAAVLTGAGLVLVAVQSYALSLLLFPLLYWWPGFQQRLATRIYPNRGRFPQVLQELGAQMALCTSVDDLLGLVASGPARLCDARSSVVFLLPGAAGPDERVRATEGLSFEDGTPLAGEILIKLMETTRREIHRDQIAVEPQYSNIETDCYASFDRLEASLLLPILREDRMIGGLAVGLPTTGDPYEPPEIQALASLAHQAVQALSRVEAIQQLKARESEFQELGRFFPPQIIDQIMAKGGAAEYRTARKLVTVFFADLRGFTSFSEGVEPEEVMSTLAEYHDSLGARIAEYGGTLERFTGDGFMVFFNDPVDQPDHVQRAAGMALAMRENVETLYRSWQQKGYEIHVGFGIHTGYATVGFVGYEGRLDYAVIGNVTNLAARLSDVAQGGEILISASVLAELKNGYQTEPAGTPQLKGISRPQPVYRLLGAQPQDRKEQ